MQVEKFPSEADQVRAVDYRTLDKLFKEQQQKEVNEKSKEVYKNVLGKQ